MRVRSIPIFPANLATLRKIEIVRRPKRSFSMPAVSAGGGEGGRRANSLRYFLEQKPNLANLEGWGLGISKYFLREKYF